MKHNLTLWTLLLTSALLLGGVGYATAGDEAAAEEGKSAAAKDEAAAETKKDIKPPADPTPTPVPEPAAVEKADCASFCGGWCSALEDMTCSDSSLKEDFAEGQKSCKKTCPKLCAEGVMPAYLTACAKSGDCKKMAACVAKESGGEEE